MKRAMKLLPWLLLWGAFVAFGIWVRSCQPWKLPTPDPVEIHGLDYHRYAWMLGHVTMIKYAAFRHPLYGWFMSPFILFGHRIREVGGLWAYWIWLVCLFSLVMTVAVWLVHKVLLRLELKPFERFVCCALFSSFASVWMLAACPESFGLSCVLALCTILWGLESARRCAGDTVYGRQIDLVGWSALALLTGGVTITQLAKTGLAYAVTHKVTKRLLLCFAGGFVLIVLLTVGIFALRMWGRNLSAAPGHAETLAGAWQNIDSYLTASTVSLSTRFHRMWVFFSEPLVTRGEDFQQNEVGTYRNMVAPLLVWCVLGCAAAGAWFNRRHPIVKLLAAMFAVDFAIHFVVAWGMIEAQIYAGHWFYGLPLLVGLLQSRVPSRGRFACSVGMLVLSVAIFSMNLFSILHAPPFAISMSTTV